jgi:hypothetical protein
MKKFTACKLALLISFTCFGQSFILPPIVRKLFDVSPVVHVNKLGGGNLLLVPPIPHHKNASLLVRTKNDLFACIAGTGIVYKLERKGEFGHWRRIDSTYFSGYNQAAYLFSLDNTIFSFGGEGLFNISGHLRYYNEQMKEWAINSLNREVLYAHNDQYTTLWVDEKEKEIYLIGHHFDVPAITEIDPRVQRDIGRVLKLKINDGIWTELGFAKDTNYRYIANSPWGIIAHNKHTVWLVDYKGNRYLKAKPSLNKKIFSYFRARNKEISFMSDGKLYFGDFDQYMDSVSISLDEFEPSGTPIYSTKSISKTGQEIGWIQRHITQIFWALLIALVLCSIGVLLLKWYRHSKTAEGTLKDEIQNHYVPRNQLYKSSKDYNLFAEPELRVLQFILEKSLLRETASIHDLNKLLGVVNKNIDIQKRIRSEMILSVNQKLSLMMEVDEPIVTKKRSDNDKRSFEYYISEKFMDKIKEIIKGN